MVKEKCLCCQHFEFRFGPHVETSSDKLEGPKGVVTRMVQDLWTRWGNGDIVEKKRKLSSYSIPQTTNIYNYIKLGAEDLLFAFKFIVYEKSNFSRQTRKGIRLLMGSFREVNQEQGKLQGRLFSLNLQMSSEIGTVWRRKRSRPVTGSVRTAPTWHAGSVRTRYRRYAQEDRFADPARAAPTVKFWLPPGFESDWFPKSQKTCDEWADTKLGCSVLTRRDSDSLLSYHDSGEQSICTERCFFENFPNGT